MRNLDFSSWHTIVTTLLSLAVVTIQQRRERLNRQINERLRTLIAAYKLLGGSFTGNLAVDPAHRRDLRRQPASDAAGAAVALDLGKPDAPGSDRARRIRDAVEAALSDIILLGTEEQVRLAGHAAQELSAGKLFHTHDLVVSLRTFIRDALDLDPVPSDVLIPAQGPTRLTTAGGRDKGDKADARQVSGGGGGMGMGGGGMGGNPSVGAGTHHYDVDGALASTHHR